MARKIETEWNGIYIVSEESIDHFYINKSETSQGLLVKKHFKEVELALYCAHLIKDGETYESQEVYYHSDDSWKDAPHLDKVCAACEEQLSLLTEGEYEKRKAALVSDNHYDGKYAQDLADIYYEIRDLNDQRYYENPIHHHPGVPRIETIGKRLNDKIMDLIWRLDNGGPDKTEEMFKTIRALDTTMEKVLPDLERWTGPVDKEKK